MSVLKIKNSQGNWVPLSTMRGRQGNGIANCTLNNDYTLTITFTDGNSYTTPIIRGEKGEKGENGIIQDGAITEAKLATALKLKVLKDYVTPEMFGAVGNGTADDTQALQAAVNIGTCVCTKGSTYKVTSPINVSGKRVDFNGASLLFSGQCAILASGTLKGTTSLSANVTSGSVLSLVDTSEIEDGDILVIEDGNNIFTAERSYYYNGGTFLVSAVVSSGSVAVTPTIDFKQYSGATVYIYSPATCDISGIADISSVNADDYFDAGIMLKACNGARIHDCACESDLYAWTSVDCSVNTYFDNINLDVKLTRFPVTQNVYGIILGASSYSYISNCIMSSDWYCVTTGAAVGGSNRVTPTQHTYIADSSLTTNSGNASGAAYGAHPNGYKSVFTNCHIVGCMVYNGAVIKECEISSPSAGSALFINGCSQDSIRPDVVIENCKISGIRTRRATQFVSDWTSYIGNIIIKDSKYTRFENVSDGVDIISLQIDGGYGFLFDWDSKDTHIGTVVIKNVKLKNITQANRVYGDTDCLIIENLYVDNTGVESGGFVIKIDSAGVVHLNNVYVVGAFTFTINNATYFFDNFYSSGTLAASSGEGSTNVYITNSVWKASQSFRTNTTLLSVINSKSLNTDIANADVITYNGNKYKKTFNGTQFVFAAL